MDEFTGVDGTISLNDAQRMQGGGPPGPGNDDFQSVKRAFLNNNEQKNVYVNYGDVNPEAHGGLFIKAEVPRRPSDPDVFYNKDVTFDIIQTEPADLYIEADPDEHFTMAGAFKLDEIVTVDGNWTPMANPSNIMGAPSTPMEAAVNNRMLYVVAGFAPGYLDPYPYGDNLMEGDYDEILTRLGVPRQM